MHDELLQAHFPEGVYAVPRGPLHTIPTNLNTDSNELLCWEKCQVKGTKRFQRSHIKCSREEL